MCEHKIDIKIENGQIVSFCTKCGAILSVQPQNITEISCNTSGNGIILHD